MWEDAARIFGDGVSEGLLVEHDAPYRRHESRHHLHEFDIDKLAARAQGDGMDGAQDIRGGQAALEEPSRTSRREDDARSGACPQTRACMVEEDSAANGPIVFRTPRELHELGAFEYIDVQGLQGALRRRLEGLSGDAAP